MTYSHQYSEERYHQWYRVCPNCHSKELKEVFMSMWECDECKEETHLMNLKTKHIWYKQPEIIKEEIV